jgi:hypothetical protein
MTWVKLLALALAWTGQVESGPRSDADLAKAWLSVCTARVKEYRIHPAGKVEEEFQLLPKPGCKTGFATEFWGWSPDGG